MAKSSEREWQRRCAALEKRVAQLRGVVGDMAGGLEDAAAKQAAFRQSPAGRTAAAKSAVDAYVAERDAAAAAQTARERDHAEWVCKNATSVSARQSARAFLDSLEAGGAQ